MLRSDAMLDPRLPASRPAAAARDADGQCRGIGPSGTPERSPGRGRGGGAWSNTQTDAPVARVVVREADGHVVRSAITRAAAAAVMRDAAERAALEWRPVASGDAAPSMQASSADLIALLDQLRTAVVRYVADRREAGAPIQRVLPEVKGVMREAGAYEGWHDPAEVLMRQVVGWTIVAFYGAPEQLPSSQEWQEAQEAPHISGRR
jgi:hypothetical protein